jgi:ATP/maltotriose-dependent transcriptional regulator MalT
MPQIAEQLVGRAAELGVIDTALAELERRTFGALELVGEPGIGKTRLLAELGERGDTQGLLVLSGSASEFERELPFWVFVDALDEYVQAIEPKKLNALGDETLAELAHVLPSLAGAVDAAPGPQDDRYRTHAAVSQLLEALATTKPLVLLLDDLHWADSGSIELLASLLRRPPPGAVLLAMAMRPRQVPERLSGALERARRDERVSTVELGALSADEARKLVGDVDGATAAALYEQSEGNPFYLEQLARSPQRPGRPAAIGDGSVSLAGVEVPPAVAAALTGELALLPVEIRRVLEGAAVAGDPFEPELAAAAAGMEEPETIDALDELLVRDLVRPSGVPRRFRFRHPLVRGAVYEAAPGAWRLGAHERVAEALAERGAPAVERAHHVESSARRGDMEAVALLREAGAAAARRTPATAARLFAGALRLLPATATTDERAGLLESLAGAQVAVGLLEEPRAAMLESLELRKDSLEIRVRLTAAIASMENLLGRHEEAHTRLVRALDELPDRPSPEVVALLMELSIDGFYRLDYDLMREFGERAVEVVAEIDNRPLAAGAVGLLALAQVFCGALGDAPATIDHGAALLDQMSDDELARSRRSSNNLAPAELYSDRYEAAAKHAERALAVARATGQGQFLPTLFWAGVIRTGCGRLAEAADLLDTAVEIARLAAHGQGLAWNLAGRSLAAGAVGDVEVALATAEEAVDAVSGQEQTYPALWAGFAHASALVPAGEPARAIEALVAAGGGPDVPRLPATFRPAAFEIITRARLALGLRDEAGEAAARACEAADELGLRLPSAIAERATAAVELGAGDAASAAERALSSATTAADVGAPVEAGLSRLLAGRTLAAAGERERAVAELQQAAGEFHACAAHGHAAQAERELGKLGKRVHRRTAPGKRDGAGIELLTERELEVARLIVDRKTNSQIATELFLSPKTVETHVRHLFQKLEVSSRVEVARVVERADREANELSAR